MIQVKTVDIKSTTAIDAAGELGHAYSLFVKYLFDKVSDVYSVRFGHGWSLLCIKVANVLI